MNEPKKMWMFDQTDLVIYGPFTIIEENADGHHLRCQLEGKGLIITILKSRLFFTKKTAVLACYEYHGKRIKDEQEKLTKRKQLLNKFYSEEYHES